MKRKIQQSPLLQWFLHGRTSPSGLWHIDPIHLSVAKLLEYGLIIEWIGERGAMKVRSSRGDVDGMGVMLSLDGIRLAVCAD